MTKKLLSLFICVGFLQGCLPTYTQQQPQVGSEDDFCAISVLNQLLSQQEIRHQERLIREQQEQQRQRQAALEQNEKILRAQAEIRRQQQRQLNQQRFEYQRNLQQSPDEIERLRREQEERDFEEARQNSLKTYAEERARTANNQPYQAANLPPLPQAPLAAPQGMEQVGSGNWEPRSGDLARAGQYIMEWQRQHGGAVPTQGQLKPYLQQRMNLNAEQVQKVIDALALY